jgi:hypothetical protein
VDESDQGDSFGPTYMALTANPAATLAARDAEKWDEGYVIGMQDEAFERVGNMGDPDANEFPHVNPYRTEQQGESK